jgi:diguanylate cyclase (GGDEF)-like protein
LIQDTVSSNNRIYPLSAEPAADEAFQTAVSTWNASLRSLELHAIELEPEVTKQFRGEVRYLRAKIAPGIQSSYLPSAAKSLDDILKRYRDRSAAFLEKREKGTREILAALTQAAQSFTRSNSEHAGRLTTVTDQLHKVAESRNLEDIRSSLARELRTLSATVSEMWQENQKSLADLQSQVARFETKLAQAEHLAYTDALTGLVNRRGAEGRLQERVALDKPFCIMVLDVNNFKYINDKFGHMCGDQVLRAVGRLLERFVGGGGTVCRWGGDEFLAMVDLDPARCGDLASRIRAELSQHYAVVSPEKKVPVFTSVTIGLAAFRFGESAEELFVRADSELYRAKDL